MLLSFCVCVLKFAVGCLAPNDIPGACPFTCPTIYQAPAPSWPSMCPAPGCFSSGRKEEYRPLPAVQPGASVSRDVSFKYFRKKSLSDSERPPPVFPRVEFLSRSCRSRGCVRVRVRGPDVVPSIYPYEARRSVLLGFCVCVLKFAVGQALLPTIYPAPAPSHVRRLPLHMSVDYPGCTLHPSVDYPGAHPFTCPLTTPAAPFIRPSTTPAAPFTCPSTTPAAPFIRPSTTPAPTPSAGRKALTA